ncbi:MAG: serine/threonine protein kinase [Planctomycetes bacterium]|nr:serine/threonine protein kinase [Planctomycetota bacterium]
MSDIATRAGPSDDSVHALAAEYVALRVGGEPAQLSAFLERLPGVEQKARLRELVAGVESVSALLPRQIRPGVTVSGRYHVRKELGKGGMGRVYEAFDERLHRRVALKVLDQRTAHKAEFASMFQRESHALAALQHPNIVAVHEAGSDGDTNYIVMDLVDGVALKDVLGTLADRLGRGHPPAAGSVLDEAIARPLPPGGERLIDPTSYVRSVARIVIEIARSLEAAHARGVVHRDLKPSNVVLRGGGQPVLLDFGLAGWLDGDRSDPAQGLYGTCAYLAPEQVRESRTGSDPKSDLYQLGLLLYEMLTLQRAFPGDDASELMERIVDGRFDRPRKVAQYLPRDLEAIVLKAIELDPRARYDSVRAMREDLARFLAGNEAPLAARGGAVAGLLRELRYFVKRNRLVAGTACAFVVGLGVTFALIRPVDAPDLKVFVRAAGSTEATFAEVLDTVAVGDQIGVRVRCSKPVVLYAVSVFGSTITPPERIAPLAFYKADRTIGDVGSRFRKELEAGEHLVLCSRIDAADLAADPQRRFEGVRVFVSDEPSASMQSWLTSMELTARAAPGLGVPREKALALLDRKPTPTRGSAIDEADVRAFQAMKRELAESLARQDDVPTLFRELQSISAYFRLAGR